ncbi:metal dependent phosphohydrolase [Andreprevotia lacus DSM 23236]|jgi:HD-GYP domain-containing protein (c-di-GMP phosphodiesterase class II)|uniref:Metal dependent phosphohydrolase n=1 Tax=Andreprevotia lacus DSM 23236 TaxID=1121001 RepID=A0A1W1XVK9_9NEIS|nr:HD domain-containing phosphohydrolase [Andreprevotia lacus]SMC27892.1 metal dependent phosphohydrolase [Andreprevotia lacus DSM 23236]
MSIPPGDDVYHTLGPSARSLTERVEAVHAVIALRYPQVHRVAMAIYDPPSDMLKTFASSNRNGQALIAYEARLHDVPSLLQLASLRQTRLVRDVAHTFNDSDSTHTQWLREQGYRASYTIPVYQGTELAAFLFFDSTEPDGFDSEVTRFLDVFADLIAQLYLLQLRTVRGLIGTVHVASGLARIRDVETGQHLERMAAYARLMGRALAPRHGLPDEFIEYLHLFAPLHDIGKVGIPDRVLLKPGPLDDEEWAIMRRHVEIGETLIEQMVDSLGLTDGLALQVMRNVVAGHHERGDGSGYPRGLTMAQIPLEARIVAVADVYDALSNRRPYKHAWREADVAAELQQEVCAGRLDGECVAALLADEVERRQIAVRFADQ